MTRAQGPNDRIDVTMTETDKRDYSETLNLPQTEFPMRAGLPKKEPEILARWEQMNVYKKLREQGKGRNKFVLHDGPPMPTATSISAMP